MQRIVFSNAGRRLYSSSSRVMAEAAPASASALILNFTSPHTTLYSNKVVDLVVLPGEGGEYGVTKGHSPIISQLKPGVVSVHHVGGSVEKFFVPGGFALSHANSVTDVSVPEAYPLSDFDEAAVKAGYAEAVKASASADPIAKAAADIEISVFSQLARALSITV